MKRFSPKVGRYVGELATVQEEIAALRERLDQLRLQEASLVTFLKDRYSEGSHSVATEAGEFEVNYSVTTRTYMNQKKAGLMLTRLGKKIPQFTTNVESFKVKAA